ncbi:MAG: prolyl oligopeptidase family serine peptidase [Bacteroidota bacterium]
MKYIRCCLFILPLFITLSFGQSTTESKTKKWTPEHIINTEYARSVSISPDNQSVVWTKRKGDKKADRFKSGIYLTRLNMKKAGLPRSFQMTRFKESDYSPFFSRNGENIYFLSSREKGKKLWKMSMLGGEPMLVKEFKNGISNIQWNSDSSFLYSSNDGKSLYQQEKAKAKDNVIVVEDSVHWTKNRLYEYDMKRKTSRRITSDKYPVSSYKVSKNGRWLIYVLNRSRHYASDGLPKRVYYLQNLATGSKKQILQGLQEPGNFQFTEDGKGFYFVTQLSSDPEWNGAGVGSLRYFDLERSQMSTVDLQHEWAMEGSYYVVDNDVLVSLANGATNILAFYQKDGDTWKKHVPDFGDKQDHLGVLDISDDFSKVVYNHSTASQLPKYYIADLKVKGGKLSFEKEEELLRLNKNLASLPIVKSEVMKWKGYNNEEVDGILYYPENYVAGKRYPLILSIHGGPAGTDRDTWSERWSTYPQILAQKGAFVLKPNYHGSSNHGQKFVESIKGHYYDLEMEDITKGLEVLNEQGKIDMDQLGVMGWSNGAILTTMLTVRYPDMFKVAAPGAGDVNWTSDFGTCRFGVTFDQSYFGGAPWDDVDGKTYNEAYITKSPLFELEKVKTPTIIFHGSEDRAVPRDQGWEYYRALQQAGKTQVRFLWFPGQPHGLGKITHQLRKMNEEIAWIDQHLFKKAPEKNEAFKKDSPLAMLLAKEKAARYGHLYGKNLKGKLIPETVKADSMEIGRFEVTNAQFKAYYPRFLFAKGQENYPAVVSYEQAKAYISWLNKRTGETYRLPNEKESKMLHKKAMAVAAKENTLNFWAGYDITPEDLDILEPKLEAINGSLFQEVGMHKATKIGEAEIFDLGGNVAEMNAEGDSYGFGAYDYVDKNQPEASAKGDKLGFRVIKE